MDEFSAEINIPEDRIAVLIGTKGSVKKALEKGFKAKMFINDEGVVVIRGPDSLKIWTLEKVVKAIGRGFNPEIARLLEKDDYDFELINLKDYGRSKNDIERLRGRVIGREGTSKKMLEDKTGAYLIVYGKTVGIIAKLDVIEMTRNAIEMLLKGAKHVTVFKYLDKENQKRVREVMLNG
ncbi:MAG: RNA-processing protein [Nanoarchaeota archaeon]|nr:RNA-processing protein [Nanoarchaeota archaeon]